MPPKGVSTQCSSAITSKLANPRIGDHPPEPQLGIIHQEVWSEPDHFDQYFQQIQVPNGRGLDDSILRPGHARDPGIESSLGDAVPWSSSIRDVAARAATAFPPMKSRVKEKYSPKQTRMSKVGKGTFSLILVKQGIDTNLITTLTLRGSYCKRCKGRSQAPRAELVH